MLGRPLLAVGKEGGDVGEVYLIQESHQSTIRDITVFTDDDEQIGRALESMASNPGTQVLEVRDEVLELHQKVINRYPKPFRERLSRQRLN
jgi:hypothetical protein